MSVRMCGHRCRVSRLLSMSSLPRSVTVCDGGSGVGIVVIPVFLFGKLENIGSKTVDRERSTEKDQGTEIVRGGTVTVSTVDRSGSQSMPSLGLYTCMMICEVLRPVTMRTTTLIFLCCLKWKAKDRHEVRVMGAICMMPFARFSHRPDQYYRVRRGRLESSRMWAISVMMVNLTAMARICGSEKYLKEEDGIYHNGSVQDQKWDDVGSLRWSCSLTTLPQESAKCSLSRGHPACSLESSQSLSGMRKSWTNGLKSHGTNNRENYPNWAYMSLGVSVEIWRLKVGSESFGGCRGRGY
ncbi:hypothetical protein QBC37DRAFT_483822 [Rhypophila decipiens]|uniref:Uncharacterized protein n=1 Tax=Rhypophila decipiens TaxID=261697 RepID=A0AAN6Y595_9PEZI|nr:hypothetical protein QBC37DRAFT_483822 [Rhypophila decipiens]